MDISVTEFKAKCLSLIDQVNKTGETLIITKRGKQVAELRPKHEADLLTPWVKLKGSISEYIDPFEPTVTDSEIESNN